MAVAMLSWGLRGEREAGASLSSCCVDKKLPERRMRRAAAKYGVCGLQAELLARFLQE